MDRLKRLLKKNREWVDRVNEQDPSFFNTLADQQNPDILWIGCSDSRVPANQIVDMLPGELFVHRNVGNVVSHSDLNCLSVMQFAVEYLNVEHVVVCGHYGCGAVSAAHSESRLGLIENWIGHIVDVKELYSEKITTLETERAQLNALCELNVVNQVLNVCQSTVLKDAWDNGSAITVHGWIYDVADGLLKDLGVCVGPNVSAKSVCQGSVDSLPAFQE